MCLVYRISDKSLRGQSAQIFGLVLAIFYLLFHPLDRDNRYAIMTLKDMHHVLERFQHLCSVLSYRLANVCRGTGNDTSLYS